MVYSTSSHSTEVIIQRTIDGIQRMISVNNNNSQGLEEDGATTGKEPTAIEISLAMKKHWESEIKILRDAPRDEKKLSEIIKVKQEEYEEAQDSEDIERLVTEIEMLKFVWFLVCRNENKEKR